MNKLIKSAMMMASVGAMLCIVGCGAKTPDAVAMDFLKTMQAGKATPEYLAKNCTAQTAQLFTMFGAVVTEDMKGVTFTVVDTKINGDKAVVKIKKEGGKKSGTEDFELLQVDGKWKVNVNKEKDKNKKD